MLDVVADIARQDKDRLEPGGDSGAGNRILCFVAFDSAVLADEAVVLNRDVPGAIGDNPIQQESGPTAKEGQGPHDRCVESELGGEHPVG